MDPIMFACVLGLALTIVECVLRLVASRRRARADAQLEFALDEEIARLKVQIARALFAALEREDQTTRQFSEAALDDCRPLASRFTVGRLIEAERDERRASEEISRLRAHQWRLMKDLNGHAQAIGIGARPLLRRVLLFVVGLGLGLCIARAL